MPMSGFGFQGEVGFIEWVGSVPSSAIFKKSLRRIGISSSLNIWKHSHEAIWPKAFVLGEIFDHSFNVSACDWFAQNFYFFPGSVLEG